MGSSPHQAGPHQTKPAGSQRQDNFLNLEWERDRDKHREGSVRTTHTSSSHSRVRSHVSQKQDDNKALPQEIDNLKKKLRHVQRKRSPSSSDTGDKRDDNYRHKIERAKLPRRFHQPTFTMYNGRTDPIEHVSQFNQKMAVHSKDETLMCKVFPSSLGPVAMRWFDGLRPNSVGSFKQLTQAFGSRFITSSRVSRSLDFLLFLSMREMETLKAYSNRYWEMYNEIEGNYDDVAISTFKSGLPTKHGLKKSLTRKPVTSLHQLMDQIDKYERVEEDQQLEKGKEKVVPQERRDFKSDRFNNNNRPRRDFAGQSGSADAQAVNAVFRDPVHQVLEKIKNESFFKWSNKMAGDPMKRNQNLYCQYHQEPGHTTQDCRNMRNHLDQLVREGKLRHLLHHSSGQQGQANPESRRDTSLRPPIGTINAILAALGKTGSCPSRVMSVARLSTEDDDRESKKAKKEASPVLSFSDEDKIGTIQPMTMLW
uniref:Retrotransposon gag domain-containing protein n=1 Tax=Quercus lobata TaxID=97700 RepID=A0A7N2MLS0_QUELO